jgi:hypothetical protein
LEGDVAARASAENFARREAQLRTSARAGQKHSSATPARRSSADPDSWLPRVLYGQGSITALPQQLPRAIVDAAGQFAAAKREMRGLSLGESAQGATEIAQSLP